MDWSRINPVLLDVLTRAAVHQADAPAEPFVGRWSAKWRDRAEGTDFILPEVGHTLELKVTTVVPIGGDEQRYETVGADEIEVWCGTRRFTLQLKSISTEDTDVLSCMAVLSRVQTAINFDRLTDALRAVDVALVGVSPARDVSAKKDGRIESVGILDLTFNAAVNLRDPIPIGWFNKIKLTSHLKVGEDELPDPPLNYTDRLITSSG